MTKCLVCRFYPGHSLQDVKNLPLADFRCLLDKLGDIIKIENGEPIKKNEKLESMASAIQAKILFGKKQGQSYRSILNGISGKSGNKPISQDGDV